MATGGKKEKARETKGVALRPQNGQSLKELTRQVLLENGEQPDCWIIAEQSEPGHTRLFCAAPPFQMLDGSNGPLLDFALAEGLGMATLLTEEKGEVETIACISYGFLGSWLCDKDFDDEDFAPEFTEVRRVRRKAPLEQMLRAALQEMIHLAYARLSSNLPAPYSQLPTPNSFTTEDTEVSQLLTQNSKLKTQNFVSPDNRQPTTDNPASPLQVIILPNGGMALKRFRPDASLNDLSEAMSGLASKAKLTRLRQTAQNCGGCGRCCHDPDIPLTYFDVQSVAAHRLPEIYLHNPDKALAQMHEMLGFPYLPAAGSMLPANRLYFRKKDGSGGANSPCIFLDGRGLCGVYLGRPLLCRLYHCAENSKALELLYRTSFYAIEWLGRAVESGAIHPSRPVTLPQLLTLPLVRIASPYALSKVRLEINK